MLLIDSANVVGSRPMDWWRDRALATLRLAGRIRAAVAASRLPESVVMVLEGTALHGVDEGVADGVTVVHAPATVMAKLERERVAGRVGQGDLMAPAVGVPQAQLHTGDAAVRVGRSPGCPSGSRRGDVEPGHLVRVPRPRALHPRTLHREEPV